MAPDSITSWASLSGAQVLAQLQREWERVRDAAPHVTLGVAASASEGERRKAFLSATKQFHPNRFARHDARIRELAHEIFLVIKRAHEKSSAQAEPSRQDVQQVPPTAPRAQGSQPEAESDPVKSAQADADKECPETAGQAATISPQDIAQQVKARQAALAARFKEAVQDLRAGKFSQARKALQEMATENTSNKKIRAYMHYAWAREYTEAGRRDAAAAEVERALRLKPDFEPAQTLRVHLVGNH